MTNIEPHYDHIAKLIRAHQTGELDAPSKAELDAWRIANADNQKLFDELMSPLQLGKELQEMNHFDAGARLAEFEQKYLEKPTGRNWFKWHTVGRVAAALAIVTVGFWLYEALITKPSVAPRSSKHTNDIAPGKQGATLTLADGRKIKLSDTKNGLLAEEDGVTISKTADGQILYEIASSPREGASKQSPETMNTLTTAKGEMYQVRLPDGSLVHLNAGSSLKFPSSFHASDNRTVTLQGEAYFSVAHQKSKPFIVKTDQQEVTVLGTEFNINAYGDDNKTLTTLLKGSVQINAEQQIVLKPGQQSTLLNGQFRVQPADTESATGWKNGVFLFYNMDMKTIMRQLARWYNIEVDMSTIPDKRFYGEISRDVKLSEVLTMLEATSNIEFKIEGRRLMLLK